MNALYVRMGDPNENFIGDFQGDGFQSRLFELGCFAYLESAGMEIDRSYLAPDFSASKDGVKVVVEAATANSPSGRHTDISLRQVSELSEKELFQKVNLEFPRRIVALLKRKLKHRYHELPHCLGRPLVLMTAPFFEPGSVFYTDDALVDTLYGTNDSSSLSGVNPPFFSWADAQSISAILYCNAFTIPRFYRLATSLNQDANIVVIRKGFCYKNHSETELAVGPYEYPLGSPSAPKETWWEGVTVFHNPHADVPLPLNLLPSTSTFSIRDGSLVRDIHGFHPVTSFMTISVPQS